MRAIRQERSAHSSAKAKTRCAPAFPEEERSLRIFYLKVTKGVQAMSEFRKDYRQSMDGFHFSDESKLRMAEAICRKSLPRRKGHAMKKFVLILAAVLIFAALCGAAIHIFWSSALPETANTTQEQRKEAEESGLSTRPADSARAHGSCFRLRCKLH